MNERIRELSAIAKHLSTDEAIHLSRVHNRTLSLDEEQEIFTEKFAELIVQECLKVAASQRNPANLNYKPSERFVEDLRQHFGVAE